MNTTPTSGAADLRTAAQAVVDRWDTPLWKDVPATAEYIGRLRAALAAGQATAAQQGAAYAALPESFLEIPDVQDESGINAYYSREVVLECIDAALASHGLAPAGAAQADSAPAVSDLPPLPAPDLRDVGTKPQEIKEFLKGYATEYARTAIAARAPADSVQEDAACEAIEKVLALFPFNAPIQKFTVNNGPCLTADNDDEFYSVKRVLAFLTEIKTTLDAARKQGEMNVQLDIDSNHSAPGQQRDVARSVALGQPMGNGQDQAAGRPSAPGDKLLTVAERNIRSFLRSATFKSESDREAALNCVDVLWEAARAPADSVQEDAACWHWLAEYLVGTRTDLDDEIVASETVNDLRKLVEAAIKQGATP